MVRSLARWHFLSGAMRFVCYLMTAPVVVAVLVALWVWRLFLIDGELPTGVWTPLAVTIALAIPPALIGVMMASWRQFDKRRILGTLWDVGTFWSRSFHPFAPPSTPSAQCPS